MITIKSEREIGIMKEAGRITALAHKAVKEAIRPGVSTKELDKIAYDVITSHGAIPSFLNYHGYPASICASINEVVIHGIPSEDIILKDGDIISIDIGACYKGYHGDCAKTHLVGSVNEERRQLVKVTQQSLFEGLKYARPNNRLSDISHAIEKYVKSYGYSVVQSFTGHGIGNKMHEDPSIPNFGEPGRGPILKKGMTLAIEPMVNIGTHKVRVLEDDWTVITQDRKESAHYEHTIVITDDGYEILTKFEGEEFNV
ncbi:MAG: type I methionyl aminopeptidase [Bacilli bacterium]|jgi:methionyl aminopeptidase|nr:type I methionyl aminopeptidase [Acholeplasmataceae bacterium]